MCPISSRWFPSIREVVPATLPVGIGVAITYAAVMRRERDLAPTAADRIAALSGVDG